MQEAGCNIYSGAPNGQPDYGIDEMSTDGCYRRLSRWSSTVAVRAGVWREEEQVAGEQSFGQLVFSMFVRQVISRATRLPSLCSFKGQYAPWSSDPRINDENSESTQCEDCSNEESTDLQNCGEATHRHWSDAQTLERRTDARQRFSTNWDQLLSKRSLSDWVVVTLSVFTTFV